MTARACYGIGCPSHRTCQRYADVERLRAGETVSDTCMTRDGRFPAFVAVETTAWPAAAPADGEGDSLD